MTPLALLAACGPDNPVASGAVEYQAIRVAEIGDDDGEGALSAVFGLAVATDGRVYLSEPSFARVVAFGPDGRFDKVLGSRGDGPGEFQVPGALFWRGDSFAVGLPARDQPVRARRSLRRAHIVHRQRRRHTVRRKTDPSHGGRRCGGGGSRGERHDGDGACAGRGLSALATFRILRLNLDGDTVARHTVDYTPRRVSDEVIDSLAAAVAEAMAEQVGVTAASLSGVIAEQVTWPQYEPPVTALLVGQDGTVWLRRERLGLDPVRWEILDEDFEAIGQVGLAAGLELKEVARVRLWAIETDSLDVPHVVRFEVRPMAPS